MPPPIHITGDPDVDWLIAVVGFLFCLYWLRALRLAREGARLVIRNIALAVLVYIVCAIVLVDGLKWRPNDATLMAGVAAVLAFSGNAAKRRSRYIPKSVKRQVIARDLKGEEYDATKHHIDHVWPFSKGGSNTADNLRVIEKKQNLKKGAKRPGMRDMW